MNKLAKSLIDFHKKAEKLKSTTRHSWLTDSSRQESVAEHSWMLCLLAIIFSDELDKKVDLLKVIKMVTIHDLAELVTGDIPTQEISKRQENKYDTEKKAMRSIVKNLSKVKGNEILSLWNEFEEKKTRESKFAQSLDKIEVILQHNISNISTWDDSDFRIHPYQRNEYFDFDSFMRALKDTADIESMRKIIGAKAQSKIDPKHLETYKKNKK